MEERAEVLYESWVNGNLSHVVEEVLSAEGARSALMACYLTEAMKPKERAVFFRMLKNKL